QVLRFYGAVATKGMLFTPHFCEENVQPPTIIEVSDRTWEVVHKGLRGAVSYGSEGPHLDLNGTAKDAKVLKRIRGIGKTGTAEVGKWRDDEGEFHAKPDHAWFAGFAPYDKPKVAFVALAEYSGLHGADLADLCGEIAEAWFNSQETTPPLVQGR
ncbi:MAG: hypothetical protein KDB07_00460, partial [Planctomycetes bacterium]|nr:hypothetical protein [Planctomycetota bacterium]